MATLTIGTASGGYYNFRGANTAPYAMGSSVVIATSGGDINISSTYEGIIISQLTFQCSGYTTTSSLYGNIWNSSGVSQTNSSAVSAAADSTPTFTSKTFNLSDQFFPRSTVYAGYARAAASPTAWDVVNGDNTTRIGNTAGSAPSGLTGTGTGTVYRRLVGTLTYDLYDAGLITRSVTTSGKTATVNFSGTNGTHAKTITINWGDGTSATSPSPLTVAASATPVDQTRTYALAGQYPISTRIFYATSSVGIDDITFSDTALTVPGPPTGLTATAASTSQINLSWTAPNYALGNVNGTVASTGGSNGTVTYQLYRGATLVYNSTGTSFNDTGLSTGTSYSYTVYATNNTGQGPVSNTASATTLVNTPGTPTSFSATVASESQINLSWSAPSSDGGSAITGYQLYRGATLIYSNTGTSYNDTGLSFETAYSYSVYAVNANGSSITPATLSASTEAGGKAKIWNGSANVSVYPKIWNGSSWATGQSKVWNGSAWAKAASAPSPTTISSTLVTYRGSFLDINENPYSASQYQISIPLSSNNGSALTETNLEYSTDNVNWNLYYDDNTVKTLISVEVTDTAGALYFRAYHKNAIGSGTPSNVLYLAY